MLSRGVPAHCFGVTKRHNRARARSPRHHVLGRSTARLSRLSVNGIIVFHGYVMGSAEFGSARHTYGTRRYWHKLLRHWLARLRKSVLESRSGFDTISRRSGCLGVLQCVVRWNCLGDTKSTCEQACARVPRVYSMAAEVSNGIRMAAGAGASSTSDVTDADAGAQFAGLSAPASVSRYVPYARGWL